MYLTDTVCMRNLIHTFKIQQLVLVLIFLISTTEAFAEKITFHFLNYDQFLSLTDSEKKNYIKEIQALNLNLTENSKVSFFQFLYQNLLFNPANAQNSRAEFNLVATDTVTELDRLDSLMRASRMYKKAAIEHNAPTAKAVSIEDSEAFVKRMNQVKSKLQSPGDYNMYASLKNEFANDFPELAKKIESVKNTAPATKQVRKETQIQNKEKTEKPATVSQKKIDKPSMAPFCIYAGFVIYGEKCSPNKKLPDDFNLDLIHKDNFKCETESEILCNPLLFGYKKNCFKVETKEICSEQPICIERSVNATKNCVQKTNSKDQFEVILNIWKNPKNKNVYEKYMKDLNQLCNTDNFTSEDVRQTCKVAAIRFNSIMDTNFPGRVDVKIKNSSQSVKSNK